MNKGWAIPVGLLILALSFLFRFHGSGSHSLWIDELCTANDARESVSLIVHKFIGNGHPFYTLLTKGSITFFGESDASVRFPAVVFGTAAVLLTALFVGSLLGARGGLAAAIVGITLPAQVLYSGNARGYSMVIFFTALSLWLLISALKRPTLRIWSLYGLSISLLLYSHLLCGGVMAAAQFAFLGLYILLNQTRYRFSDVPLKHLGPGVGLAFVIAGVLTAFAYSPWYLNASHVKDMQTYSTYQMNLLVSTTHCFTVWWNWTLSSSWYWQVLWLGLVALGFVRLYSVGLSTLNLLVTCWIVVPILLNSVITDTACLEDRYVVYWLPLLVLMTILGSETLLDRCKRVSADRSLRFAQLTLVQPVAAMLVLMLANAGPAFNAGRFHLDDWHGAARLITSFHPNHSVVLMPPNCQAPYTLTYYGVPADRIVTSGQQFGLYDPAVSAAVRERKVIWFISRHSFLPSEYLSEENSKNFFQVTTTFLSRISLWCRLPEGDDPLVSTQDRLKLQLAAAEAMQSDPIMDYLAAGILEESQDFEESAVRYKSAAEGLYSFAFADPRFADPRFGVMQAGLLEWIGRVERARGEVVETKLGDPSSALHQYARSAAFCPRSSIARRGFAWCSYRNGHRGHALFLWVRTAEAYAAEGRKDESTYHMEKAQNLGRAAKSTLIDRFLGMRRWLVTLLARLIPG